MTSRNMRANVMLHKGRLRGTETKMHYDMPGNLTASDLTIIQLGRWWKIATDKKSADGEIISTGM